MKLCRTCGRPRHRGLCDMATLEDGKIVHVSRIVNHGGVEYVGTVRVRNRWIKQSTKENK
jgi:NMD protein affecting ribosome stability and mRNA decay